MPDTWRHRAKFGKPSRASKRRIERRGKIAAAKRLLRKHGYKVMR